MNPIEFANAVFVDRTAYYSLPDKIKEDRFFWMKRQLSRKMPEHTENFNHRNVNKVAAMNTLVMFIEMLQNSGDKDFPRNRIPGWFWEPKTKVKKEEIVPPTIDEIILQMVATNTTNQPDSEV